MTRQPKVTINRVTAAAASPSAELIAAALSEVSVKDAKGREIMLRKPSPFAPFKLAKVMGESAENRTLMRMYLPLLFVSEIGGDPVFFPETELQMEALVMLLDEHGLAAVMNGVNEHFGETDEEAQKNAVRK